MFGKLNTHALFLLVGSFLNTTKNRYMSQVYRLVSELLAKFNSHFLDLYQRDL